MEKMQTVVKMEPHFENSDESNDFIKFGKLSGSNLCCKEPNAKLTSTTK